MMRMLLLSLTLLSAAAAFGPPAMAMPSWVERSGPAFHIRACPGPAAGGTARCHAHIVTDSNGVPVSRSLTTNITPQGYGPADLRSAYNVTGTGTAATTIAIVDAYGYNNAERDLGIYRSTYGLPPCTTANGCFRKVNQYGTSGSYPRQNTGWAQETALDLEMASAICPGCKILLVEGNAATFVSLGIAENTAASLGAHVISNSYGGSEAGSSSYESYYNHPGVAITVSSGDSGYGVEFPASSPHVTAVGGTSLVHAANTRGWDETAWAGAGSGCSAIYGKPAWQTDAGCAMRTVADVSAVADPNTGVAVYGPVTSKRSGWMVFGGTSVAAPLVAGAYGVNGGAVTAGSDPYAHAGALYDVTVGSNGNCGTYLCTAAPGYDGPTGLGTPNGSSAF